MRSAPANAIRPDVTGTSPMIDLSNVVFPTPLRPRTAVTSPGATSKETLRRMWLPP